MSEAPSQEAGQLPTSNVTHANITGKVPQTKIKRRNARKGRRNAKSVSLESHRKSHVNQLKKQAVISPSAATKHGL